MINIERLKDVRYDANLTQQEIAKKLNITKSAYARYENENDNFPIKQLVKVCKILKVSIDYLFDITDIKNYDDNHYLINAIKSGKRLKKFRADNSLTQQELAKIINVDRSVISKYESGKNLIATYVLYAICKKYNISADYLLGKIDML